LAIRIRLGVRARFEPRVEVRVVALVNSGFEADTPQLLVPMKLAVKLGLYQRLPEARIESYGTSAGPVRMYVLPQALDVWVEEPDAESPVVITDAVISDVEVEVLISDYLAGELGLIGEDFRHGVWRLRTDQPGKQRSSYPPQKWV